MNLNNMLLPWQPMETAPKNRPVLLYWDNAWSVGQYCDDALAKYPKPFWNCEWAEMTNNRMVARRHPPTAWMELTKPMQAVADSVVGDGFRPLKEKEAIESGDEKLSIDLIWSQCLFVGEQAGNVGIIRRKVN